MPTTPLRIVIASANPDKAAEMTAVLSGVLGNNVVLVPRPTDVPDVDETGETLEDNARLKAVALCDATGLIAVADDTGLEVAALNGAPGVYSARYAGERATYQDNVDKLLGALSGKADRSAQFRTAVIARFPNGDEIVAEGAVRGQIAPAARGADGFGYDPLFIPDEGGGRTFAEMDSDEKHAISHRGRALRALAERLAEHGETTCSS